MCVEEAEPWDRAGLQGGISLGTLVFSHPSRNQPCGYWKRKKKKMSFLFGNLLLALPINGKVLNQSSSHREPASSGCLFMASSLIKPHQLLKIAPVPYENRRGVMQKAGNEPGRGAHF